jgi:hypothetical protein
MEAPDETPDATGTNLPLRSYDLVGGRSRETQHFALESRLTIRSTSGKLKSVDTFRQFLMVTPGDPSDGESDRFTCSKFSIQRGDDPTVGVPSLEGFSYEVNRGLLDENGFDDQGRLYGIPEELFEGLADSTGEKLSFEIGYQVYSVFFYYHGYTDYAMPTQKGTGVQDLERVGDKIVHDAAFAELPIPGKLAKTGSVWKNGEVTLEFRGLETIEHRLCAVLSFDSGSCSWSVPMNYMPVMKLKTTGVSNYRGDIHLDLESKLVKKVEMVLSETTATSMWGIPVNKSVPTTNLTIKAISQEEFDMG